MSAPRLVSILAILALFLTGPVAQATPSLVQISDTLLKADGTPFNGTAVITWRTFIASDGTTIAGNTTTVQIIDGVLKVKLVPTSNATGNAYYVVRFNSDGKTQFTEVWTVPATTAGSVQLADVRVVVPPGSQVLAPANSLQIGEVTGLAEALAIRPTKSVGYTTDRVAMIDSQGQLAAVSGSVTDCVRVDGTSGACGGNASLGFVDFETPTGLTNGANLSFSLGQTPSPARSLLLFRNGILQSPLVDFSLNGNTITFTSTATTPQSGDVLTASYRTGGQ